MDFSIANFIQNPKSRKRTKKKSLITGKRSLITEKKSFVQNFFFLCFDKLLGNKKSFAAKKNFFDNKL